MIKHTPGPWTDSLGMAGRPVVSAVNQSLDIAVMSLRGKTEEEVYSNARLIAAAPELLEALEESLAAMERMDALLLKLTESPKECEKGEIVRARSVIAKAKGE